MYEKLKYRGDFKMSTNKAEIGKFGSKYMLKKRILMVKSGFEIGEFH